MTSDYNDKQIWPAYSVSPLGAFVVTDKCKNVEEVMRIADWFYDTEHSDWSIQGVPLGMWEEDATVGWSTKDVEGGREIEHAWPAEYDDYQTFSHQRCTADYGTFPNIPSRPPIWFPPARSSCWKRRPDSTESRSITLAGRR